LVALFRAVSHCKRHRSAVPAPESHSSKTVQGVETPATIEFPARSCKFRPMPGRAGICGIPKRLALRGAPAPLTVAEPAAEYCTVSAIRDHRLFLCEYHFWYTSYYPTRWIRFVKMRPVQKLNADCSGGARRENEACNQTSQSNLKLSSTQFFAFCIEPPLGGKQRTMRGASLVCIYAQRRVVRAMLSPLFDTAVVQISGEGIQ
jgi:hypothetical protein